MKTLAEILPSHEFIKSRVSGNLPVTQITADSRAVTPGTLFFAVRGNQGDGHSFIEQALSQGAAAVVIDRPEVFEASNLPAVLVTSSRLALARGAHFWFDRPSEHLRAVGITGTNGKTTTTFLLHQLWAQMGQPAGLIGTVQNQVGDRVVPAQLTTPDPISLQRLLAEMVAEDIRLAAMEVTSIAVDQDRVAGTHFACGIFSNLTQDHLDYHGTFERYYEAKKRFFTAYPMKQAIVNADDDWGRRLAREIRVPVLTFSAKGAADFGVKEASFSRDGIRARLQTPGGELDLISPFLGRHNLANLLSALAANVSLGFSAEQTVQALARCAGAPGRLERVAANQSRPAIFVDYAHTPDALENVLQSLQRVRAGNSGKIICVFGCGGDRDRTKRPIMAGIAARLSDVCVVTSDNPRTEDPDRIVDEVVAGLGSTSARWHREVERRKAIQMALEIAAPEDFVLVAGKGHETYQIIGREKLPFDDRTVIREYYGNG